MTIHYLDNAATTPLSPEVRAAMEPWLGEQFGNPSSPHALGVRASEALGEATRSVCRAVGAHEREVVFTSGGTEANNLAVLGAARARKKHGTHVLIGATEHPSVREAALSLRTEGFTVEELPLDGRGALDLDRARRLLRADTVLVAQMLVQNEVGTLYAVPALAREVRRSSPRAHVHVDAVQALGWMELSIEALGADSLTLSAHKAHGPKGAGALIVREGARLSPLLLGGGQQRGLRSGTENVPAIVGMGRAVELAAERREQSFEHLRVVRAAFLEVLSDAEGVRWLGAGASEATSPAIVALLVAGAPAEVWLHHLEARGVFAGMGSACQSRKGAVSPTWSALGLSAEEARSVLRFSFTAGTSATDVRTAARMLLELAPSLAGARA